MHDNVDKTIGLIKASPPPWKEPLTKARITYRLLLATAAHRDADNLYETLKGVQDGLVRAGVIKDDSIEVVGHPILSIEVDKSRAYRCIVEVEEA